MAEFDSINVGTTANDDTGDSLRDGGQKVNSNFSKALNKTIPVAANLILAGPVSGADDAPTYRALVVDDIPSLTLAKISDSGDAASKDVGTASGTVAAGDDSRFSDAREPTIHGDDKHSEDYIKEGDSRLSDSREWTASTVTQAAAEAGTSTTRRAWTAKRVRQAIAAWWSDVSIAISKVTGLQSELDGKEPTFTKNTAFNKDFGSAADTVTEGNDSRLSDAREPTSHDNTKHSTNYEAEGTASGLISTHESDATAHHSNVNDPTADEKAALAGTGTPSSTNKYVNDDDSRLSDTREPTTHDNTKHSTNYEAAFTKNTAFNKDFGSVADTVTEGDDGRLSDAREPTSHDNTKHSTNYAAESDSRFPTADEKDALAGVGTPSSANKYVTESALDDVGEGVFSFDALFEAEGYSAEVDMSDSDNQIVETIKEGEETYATRTTEFDTPDVDKNTITVVCTDLSVDVTKIVDMTDDNLITYNDI